jgi:hypothetical protein
MNYDAVKYQKTFTGLKYNSKIMKPIERAEKNEKTINSTDRFNDGRSCAGR